MPSISQITQCLQDIVRTALANDESITVNNARARAERQLGLDDNYLKTDNVWKVKSRDIIQKAFEHAEDATSSSNERKRSSPANTGSDLPAKRLKTEKSDGKPAGNPEKQEKAKHTLSAKSKSFATSRPLSRDAASDSDAIQSAESSPRNSTAVNEPKNENISDDDSDMSSLIDEGPAPKKRRKKQKEANAAVKKKQSTPANGKTLSSDEETIKTLQSQLVKCGIRKLWHRELEQCSTAKEKIKHLKRMLEDVGMVGRFSAAKAEQIRETRELAAELEAAQEFEKSFGKADMSARAASSTRSKVGRNRRSIQDDSEDGNEGSEDSRPPIKAGAATGLVDFGDSGDDGSD